MTPPFADARPVRPRAGERRAPTTAFSELLDEALRARAVTLTWVRDRLAAEGHRTSLTSLSYWRSGQRVPERQPSLDAVRAMESLLGLPADHLLSALPAVRRPGPPGPLVDFVDLVDPPQDPTAEESATLATFGFEGAHRRQRVTLAHLVVDVDEHGDDVRISARTAIRAIVEGLESYSMGLGGLTEGETAALLEVHGARVGREAHLSSLGVQAWLLDLDRPLRVGESHVIEHALRLPPTRHQHVEYYAEQPVRELMLWARFDARRPPASAEVYEVNDGEETATPLDVHGLCSLSTIRHGFGPGTLGLRWSW
ncbi:hypothetical protein [Nocardioides nanhaiensis]